MVGGPRQRRAWPGRDAARRRAVTDTGHAAARCDRLSSPWDVAWSPDARGVRRRDGRQPHASGRSTASEGPLRHARRDDERGPASTARAADAWFAQTSGLAVGPDGRIWLADSEVSALRWLDRPTHGDGHRAAPPSGRACSTSATGTAPADQALLQHPLGVAVLPDGSVAIADTYNGAVRRYAPAAGPTARVRSRRSPATSPSRPACSSTRTTTAGSTCSSSSPPRTGSPGCACRPGWPARSSTPARTAPQRPVSEVGAGRAAPGRRRSPRRRARSTTTATDRPPGCRSRATPPGLLLDGAGDDVRR